MELDRERAVREPEQRAAGDCRATVANRGIGGRSYESGKAAVLQFTRAAAVDWARQGVTVNAICPGLFMTDKNKMWN